MLHNIQLNTVLYKEQNIRIFKQYCLRTLTVFPTADS